MFSKLYIFQIHNFALCSYNLETKTFKFLGRLEIKLFYIILKKLLVVFRRTVRVFHFFLLSFLLVLISSCLYFFKCFYCCLHFFTLLLLHCLFCDHKCYVFEKAFFTLKGFWHYTSLQLLSRLPWGWQFCLEGFRASPWGSKHRPVPSVCHKVTQY